MQENKLEMKDFVPNLLRRTEIPCMRLKLVDTTPGIAESKFGGRGYVPHDAAIPTNSEGVQMRLLAQIDCRQITIPDFPTSGLLQFWAINDDLTGCDFDNNTEQKDFRICYYETVDPTVTEEEVAAKEGNNLPCEEDFFPIEGCFGLKNPLALRTWFYRILVNEALQYLRRQKREVPLGEEHTEAMTYEEPAFDEDKQAYEAVMQLSEPMKTVIILHYYEDLTLKQIAEITDTPLSTVKTRLYSALKKLKLILKEEEK